MDYSGIADLELMGVMGQQSHDIAEWLDTLAFGNHQSEGGWQKLSADTYGVDCLRLDHVSSFYFPPNVEDIDLLEKDFALSLSSLLPADGIVRLDVLIEGELRVPIVVVGPGGKYRFYEEEDQGDIIQSMRRDLGAQSN